MQSLCLTRWIKAWGLIGLLQATGPPIVNADDGSIVAVFSSEVGPYQDALKGLESALGKDFSRFFLSQGKPDIPRARIVLAFGSKAANRRYGGQPILIYSMAPGTSIDGGNAVEICMMPDAGTLIGDIRKIQPGIKRLGVFWQAPMLEHYMGQLGQVSSSMGVSLQSVPVSDNEDIPDRLRSIYGKIDALWLPPDPLLLNAQSLNVFIEFSRSNKIPLYVPTGGLVGRGAIASIGASFNEVGRLAGITAKDALQHKPKQTDVYPANLEIIINLTAAGEMGIEVPQDAIAAASKIIP